MSAATIPGFDLWFALNHRYFDAGTLNRLFHLGNRYAIERYVKECVKAKQEEDAAFLEEVRRLIEAPEEPWEKEAREKFESLTHEERRASFIRQIPALVTRHLAACPNNHREAARRIRAEWRYIVDDYNLGAEVNKEFKQQQSQYVNTHSNLGD